MIMSIKTTTTTTRNRCTCVAILLMGVVATLVTGYPSTEQNPNYREFGERRFINRRHTSHSAAAAETTNASPTPSANSDVVVGKFKAPAPEHIQKSRLRSDQTGGAQVLGASMMVADGDANEKLVHGIGGRSEWGASAKRDGRSERVVSAKMQVSDEGLNYPPSKLSADIYGNVAEIITAPPSAVDPEFLVSYPANEQQNMKQLLHKEQFGSNKKKHQKLHKRERKFY